ncbi:MAG TPA: Ig-like domain-containing protein [Solirubrobacterales bacterium]|nr:Ig-like domain-containing protein [Solirubrobacterales bacterium]
MGALVFAAGASAAPLPTVTSIDCNTDNPAGAGELTGFCSVRVKAETTGNPTGFAPVTSDSAVRIVPATSAGFKLERLADGESSFVFGYEAATAGPHTLTASYGGDANHAASQGSLEVVVPAARHITRLNVDCGTLKVGQRSTCSAFVRDLSTPATSPTGLVEFHAFGRNSGGFSTSRCRAIPLGLGLGFCTVGFTPTVAVPEEFFFAYEGDKTHRPAILDTVRTINP